MRHRLNTMLLLALLTGCATSTPIGPLSVATLEQTAPAFARAEVTSPEAVSALGTALASTGAVELTVFFGDWCPDSQREVPRLLALVRALPPEQVSLTLVNLPREKAARTELLGGVQLARVPTILIGRHGRELGRIVEQPRTTLAGDWLALLQ